MPSHKQGAFVGRVFSVLSPERLRPFSNGPSEPRWEALARYAWNVALCEAFYPSLHFLEVVLRNNIDHAGLSAFPYTSHGEIDSWLDANPSPLEPKFGQGAVHAAKKALLGWDAPNNCLRTPAIPVTHGHLVAELNFGFWTGMLNTWYMYQSSTTQRLWPHLLPMAFPHVVFQHPSEASGPLNRIRKFRNRVFHHEPIWRRPNLLGDRDEILKAIGWMSPETARTVRALDRVVDVASSDFQRRLRISIYRESKR